MSDFYRVYKNGAYMGETCAVSEKQAINNVRHRTEGDYSSQYDSNWSAILQEPEYILCAPPRVSEPDLTKDNFKSCYYTANYDGTDGLYLTVMEENKDNFIKSLKPCAPLKTDLKGFFNRELEAVGELNGMTVFYIGSTEDLFGSTYYYEPVYIQDENRIFIKYGKHHGRDFNFINGRWR